MRLYVYLIFITPLLLLYGCADYDKVTVKDIDYLEIEIDDNQPINHGHNIEFEVLAVLKNGAAKNITRHPSLQLETEVGEFNENRELEITKHPVSFTDDYFPISLAIFDEESTAAANLIITPNYKGDIIVDAKSPNGESGSPQRKSGVTLFNRNGVEGLLGIHGKNGVDGPNCTAYLWREGKTTYLRVENDSSGVVWKYKSHSCDSVLIDLSAGDAGNGGNGGEGGDGKHGKSTKAPGNGGDGGDGGNGGNGGKGGSILLFVHSNAETLVSSILIIQKGGIKGTHGLPGIGGAPGASVKGQSDGISGNPGILGVDGQNGIDGPPPVISIIDFDFSQFN